MLREELVRTYRGVPMITLFSFFQLLANSLGVIFFSALVRASRWSLAHRDRPPVDVDDTIDCLSRLGRLERVRRLRANLLGSSFHEVD